jgi:hypothetical protein
MENKKYQRCKFSSLKISLKKTEGAKKEAPLTNYDVNCKEMLTVQCSCGEKILVVPDLDALKRAIKTHKAKHKEANEQFLAEKIIEAVAEKNIFLFNNCRDHK